jgi:hypothetical protein
MSPALARVLGTFGSRDRGTRSTDVNQSSSTATAPAPELDLDRLCRVAARFVAERSLPEMHRARLSITDADINELWRRCPSVRRTGWPDDATNDAGYMLGAFHAELMTVAHLLDQPVKDTAISAYVEGGGRGDADPRVLDVVRPVLHYMFNDHPTFEVEAAGQGPNYQEAARLLGELLNEPCGLRIYHWEKTANFEAGRTLLAAGTEVKAAAVVTALAHTVRLYQAYARRQDRWASEKLQKLHEALVALLRRRQSFTSYQALALVRSMTQALEDWDALTQERGHRSESVWLWGTDPPWRALFIAVERHVAKAGRTSELRSAVHDLERIVTEYRIPDYVMSQDARARLSDLVSVVGPMPPAEPDAVSPTLDLCLPAGDELMTTPASDLEQDEWRVTPTDEMDTQARAMLRALFAVPAHPKIGHDAIHALVCTPAGQAIRSASSTTAIALFHAGLLAYLPQEDYDDQGLGARTRSRREERLDELMAHLLAQHLPLCDADLCRSADKLVASPITWFWPASTALDYWLSAVREQGTMRGISTALRERLVALRESGVRLTGAMHPQRVADFDSLLGVGQRPANVVQPGDGWGNAALASLDRVDSEERAVWLSLLEICKTATSAKPAAGWLKSASTQVDAVGEVVFRRHALAWFDLFTGVAKDELYWANRGLTPYPSLSERNTAVLKGLVWCCSLFEDAEPAAAIGDVAIAAYRGNRSIKLGNACVWSLGAMPGMCGVVQLQRLGQRIKDRGALRLIEQALAGAAARAELSRDDLDELGAQDFGLVDGRVRREIGGYTAEISAVGGSRVETRWFKPDGPALKSAPAAVKREHRGDLKALRRTADEIGAALLVHRDRLDRLMLSTRCWSLRDLRERYLDHPLLALVARRLIWSFGDEEQQAGAWLDAGFVDAEDRPLLGLADETRVRLWHPIDAQADGVVAWRTWLERHQIQQPFKQAHREVYLLTDAEQRTTTYSNRFAAHIIRQHQFNALCTARGWHNQLRLMVDDVYPPASRALPEWGLRAEFWVEGAGGTYGVDTTDAGTYLHLATDQVRFYRINDAQRMAHAGGGGYHPNRWFGTGDADPLPLDSVPPLVFSEIMRDVDLFVGVASVANDPQWQDGGPQGRYQEYWQGYSFGDLSATAQTRRAVLERLLPRLKIAERCRLTDRFLVVQGELRTYKIHLGSGNILMEPNDQYLCIVPGPAAAAGAGQDAPLLPFEGDRMFSIILSKAFLLAGDRNIKDPSITRQIGL